MLSGGGILAARVAFSDHALSISATYAGSGAGIHLPLPESRRPFADLPPYWAKVLRDVWPERAAISSGRIVPRAASMKAWRR